MRFTPVLIVYLVLLMITAVAVRELNKCTTKLDKYKIKTQGRK